MEKNNVIFNTQKFIETYFVVKTKDKKIIPFILNSVQKSYLWYKTKRDIILKGRQHGFTRLKAAEYLYDCITNFGTTSAIVGHDQDAMQNLFDDVKLMYHNIPDRFRPEIKYESKEEMYFPKLNSRYIICTYRQGDKIRSQTVNNILMTEVGLWEGSKIDDIITGMIESVPISGNITFESTPGPMGNYFWNLVNNAKRGMGIYKLFIYPWFVNKDYAVTGKELDLIFGNIKGIDQIKFENEPIDDIERFLMEKWGLSLEQILWRRYKMLSMEDMNKNIKGAKVSKKFSKEYECAFLQHGMPVFDAAYLVPVCKFRDPAPERKYIHGADTSEGVEGGNYNVLYTIDFDTGEVVNKIRGLWKPKEFAERIHKIGMQYGGLVGVENNNTGHAVLLRLEQLFEEEALRIDEEIDKKYSKIDKSDKSSQEKIQELEEQIELDIYDRVPYKIFSEKNKIGWTTNELSRKTMFVEGEQALREGSLKLAIEDTEGLDELLSCHYDEKMKEKAPDGKFDDSVIALLIAWQMRKYYQFYFEKSYVGVAVI
jgi:hypothetical protein